uniref:Envelope glycoprotein UL132 n=1 Tax=Caenorhabditis tropicalis TaxID=1561998 RepID=A0A1I7UQC6_9PELO
METTTELADTTDHSIYGLVVFLVILIFFASLTTGLILCLLKIWCTFHEQRRNSTFDQRTRRSIVRSSPNFDDSDDESETQTTLSKRRFSQRLMSYVTKTLDKREPTKENIKTDIEQPQIHGRTGSVSSRRLPAINVEPTSDVMETLMKDLEGIPSRRNNYEDNDPANVIDV